MCLQRLIFLIIFLGIYSHVSGQNYSEGYIISHENDTLQGKIKTQGNFENYDYITFKSGKSPEIRYTPDEIKEITLGNGKFYKSHNVPGYGKIFLEYLVKGQLSLYKYKDVFLVKKENKPFEILKRFEQRKTQSQSDEAINKSNKYRGILTYFVGDCHDLQKRAMKTPYSQRSFTNLVKAYNQCVSSEFQVYQENLPWVKLKFGISGYYEFYNLRFEPKSGEYKHLGGVYKNQYPQGGILVDISFPRMPRDLMSLQLEAIFSQNIYSFNDIFVDDFNSFYFDSHLKYNRLSLPVSLRYALTRKGIKPIINVGLLSAFNFVQYNVQFLENPGDNNIVYIDEEEGFFEMAKTQLGVWGGVGLSKSLFNKIELQAGIRFTQFSRFFVAGIQTPTHNSMNFTLTLRQL